MRILTALAALALLVGIGFALAPRPLQSQAAADEATPSLHSSLQLGDPFDLVTQQQFEQQLTFDERATLVRLRSRYALADPDCPLPTSEPTKPFYVKLKGDMTRELADSLEAAGANFIGYYNPHAHLLRADNAAELSAIGDVLKSHPLVAGTLQQTVEDKLDKTIWKFATSSQDHRGEYQLLFWRDVTAAQARELLHEANALVLEATVDKYGLIDLDTPCLSVKVDEPGFQVLLGSHLLEQISYRWHFVTTNQTSAGMSNADPATIGVAPYNLDGAGQIVGVWDQGPARDTHDDFQSASTPNPFGIGTKRVLKIDTTTDTGGGNYVTGTSAHGTHVTGTIAGDGSADSQTVNGEPEAKGYAPKAWVLSHNWDNLDQQRREAKHNWNHVADNHSWSDWTGGYGAYSSLTQLEDFTNRDFFLCQVQSAGNYAQYGNRPFSDSTMTVYAANGHRNGLIIAACNDSEDIANFSSRGPMEDGRLVPQFTANGVSVRSTVNSGDTDYASYQGTSMSGPSVCGSVVLLSQLWRREHNDRVFPPDVARGVLAITARDKFNTGPDYRFGFGIVDCQAAADLILADKQNGKQIVRGAVRSGGTVEYAINVSSSTEPLRVVLSWLDVYANVNANPSLVNDLDVELEAPGGTIHFPYSGVTSAANGDEDHVFTTTGPNTRDNLELVHVDSPATGTWTLRVKGTSVPANPQTGFNNDVCGYVLVSDHEIGAQQLKVEDSLNGATPVSIPDNSATGITRSFTVSDPRVITGVRVITRIMHERRGDLEIELEHPGGTIVTLKSEDSGPEDDYTDVIGVFPDTRQPDDDVTALMCLPVNGTWKVHIRDRANGNTGELHYLALELDVRTNVAPVADAGSDFDVREDDPGQLDASGTVDGDGDPITYAWTQTGGAITLNLSSSSAADPTFTAPGVSQDEVVTFELVTTDCAGAFTTDTLLVTVLNNAAPQADAGADFGIIDGDNGALDASGTSDAESDPLTYAWAQISGNVTINLSSSSVAAPTFTAPAVTQNEPVEFELTVTDDRGDFTTDTVVVTVEVNVAPVANAGADIGLVWSASGQLDGSASYDPNSGDTLSYQWTQVGGANTVMLSNDTDPQPTFTAPGVDDTLVFELTVTDARGLMNTDSVAVYVNETGALPKKKKGGGDDGGGGCSSGDDRGWLLVILLALVSGAFLARRRETV